MNLQLKMLLVLLSSLPVYGLQEGSDRFTQFRKGTRDFGVLVDMGKNSDISNNLFFTDSKFVNAIAETQFPNGSGQKYVAASAMNFEGNYVMAAAKTDPRSSGFITNSMDKLLTNPQAELELQEGLKASKLGAAQAGENAARYIAAEIITPDVGYYQTADNEQSFESAYDNVLLGQAEEALFKGDEASSLEYFNGKVADYKKSDNKQIEATNYQRDGLMRSKKTAETFRDFFQMKASVSQQNLNLMPTTESLLSQCQSNTPQGEDLFGIYKRGMPKDELAFYNFTPPSYNFDFCEQYVHDEGHFLVRNDPVKEQLQTLVSDSTEMANGLNEISQKLSDNSLSIEQIAETLSNSPAWKTLAGRAQAYKECSKTNCLEIARKTLGSLVNYPGSEGHKSQLRLKLRAEIENVISTQNIPRDYQSKNYDALAMKENGNSNSKNSQSRFVKGKSTDHDSNNNDHSSLLVGKGRSPASTSKSFYSGKRYPTGGGYFRGEGGVLRGPSGKPVQGYHSPAHLDIFQIISRRYLLKVEAGEL